MAGSCYAVCSTENCFRRCCFSGSHSETAKSGAETGYSYLQMFLGEMPGAMGETSKLLLLIGFAYMCYKKIVNAEAAVTYIGTVTILTFIFGPDGLFTGDILLNLFGGGLIMGVVIC